MVKIESFSFKIRNEPRGPPLTTLLHSVLGVPVREISQDQEIEGIQIRKGEVKLLFVDDMTLSIENPKVSAKKTTGTKKQIQ